jgi:hypothetical protein
LSSEAKSLVPGPLNPASPRVCTSLSTNIVDKTAHGNGALEQHIRNASIARRHLSALPARQIVVRARGAANSRIRSDSLCDHASQAGNAAYTRSPVVKARSARTACRHRSGGLKFRVLHRARRESIA